MFKVKKEESWHWEYEDQYFNITVDKYKLIIDDVGEVSYTGNTFTIYSYEQDHLCGAHGYGQGMNDFCEGCDESNRRSDILHQAYVFIKREVGLD